MTVTGLQPDWPVTVNSWTYPQLLPVGLNLGGLEQNTIELGFSVDAPVYLTGIDCPPGDRLATVVAWTFTVTVNSKADKAFMFVQAQPGWVVTTDGPLVTDDGSGNFMIGSTLYSPPTGPGLPLGTTVVTVTPVGLDVDGTFTHGIFPGLYGSGQWHFTIGGSNSTFTVPAAADITFETCDVEYTTEADPTQVVWHAVEAGDSYTPGGSWTFSVGDLGNPHPPPADFAAGQGKYVSIDIEVESAADPTGPAPLEVNVQQGSANVFEDSPDSPLLVVPSGSPIFDTGTVAVFGDPAFEVSDGAVAHHVHWFTREVQGLPGDPLLIGDYDDGTFTVNRLDIWYERQLDPPVALFTAIPDTGPMPLAVNFDASASYDPTTTYWPLLGIQTYEWDFDYGAGPFATDETDLGPTTSYVYTIPGTYVVALRVTDGDGQTDIAFATITVGPHVGKWKVGHIGLTPI